MLTAVLEAPIGDDHRHVGPSEYFRSEGETLKSADGSHVAVHRGGLWQTSNSAFIAISFTMPVALTFDDPNSGTEAHFGPYSRLRIVNGSVWVTVDDNVQLLAHFSDLTGLWTIHPRPATQAANLTIRPADASRD
jgi:hypothetical protein